MSSKNLIIEQEERPQIDMALDAVARDLSQNYYDGKAKLREVIIELSWRGSGQIPTFQFSFDVYGEPK